VTPAELESNSLIAVYSAIAIYAVAFILFTIDLSRRAAAPVAAETAVEERESAAPAASARLNVSTAQGVGITTTAVLEKTRATPRSASAPDAAEAAVPGEGTPRYLRAAIALTGLAWLIQLAGDVMRGLAAGRVPWANMYEFTLTATLIIVAVFLVVQFFADVKFVGAFITGLVTLFLGGATTAFYVAVTPLPPALQSYWLVIHVFVASLGTGFYAIGAVLAILQLLRQRREHGGLTGGRWLDSLPTAMKLETLGYRINIIGFVLWTFTLIAGAIWAEHAWGRYWGWDTKEVWTFVIWVVYAGYIHARATRGWRGTRAAWLSIIGFAAVIFNFTVVNIFFHGLHAYSGL